MSVFKKICTGLLLSSLSFAAQAAQTQPQGGQTPGQLPSEVSVDITSAKEVIQVLHVGVASEMRVIDLIRERNPDETLQQFVDQLSQDVTDINAKLQELAASKQVGLAPEEMTENAKKIEAQMSAEVEALSQTSDTEFRAAVVDCLVKKFEQAVELYTMIEQGSADEELKAAIAELRPVTEKHLADLKAIQSETTNPTQPQQPTEPEQPTE